MRRLFVRRQSKSDGASWHASTALLAAYARGLAGPVDAASLESHLVQCPLCRAELHLVLSAEDEALLRVVRDRVVSASQAVTTVRQGRTRMLGPWVSPWWRLVLQPDSLVAAVVAVAMAGLLDVLSLMGTGATVSRAQGGLLWLVAPALPLAGLALCAVRRADPWGEALLSTPSAGLRLTLWRALLVLAVAIPLAAGLGMLLGAASPVVWLLPCLGLTTAALALGTVLPLERACVGLGALWCLVSIGPPLARAGGISAMTLRDLAAGVHTSQFLFGGVAQQVWIFVAAVAAVLLVLRRAAYEQMTFSSRGSAA